MPNTSYQGVSIVAGQATSTGKRALATAQDEASRMLVTIRMPAYTRVTPAMLCVPARDVERVQPAFASYGAFFDKGRYWYLPGYKDKNGKPGAGCSTAVHVSRDKDGTILVTAPLSDFTGTRMMPRDAALKANVAKAPKTPRKAKAKAPVAPVASTATQPTE
jgi:hypothetical protein